MLPILTFFGGLLAIFASLLKWIYDSHQDIVWISFLFDRLPPPEILGVAGGILVLVCAFISSGQNAKYQAKIEALNTDLRNFVSGGDSYVYLAYAPEAKGGPQFTVVHAGDYPVYDVRFIIKNAREHLANPNTTDIQNPDFPVITSDMRAAIPNLYLPKERIAEYIIDIDARNGSWLEVLQLIQWDGHWEVAYRVHKRGPEMKTIKEHVDKGYPRTAEGEINWVNVTQDSLGSYRIGLPSYEFRE